MARIIEEQGVVGSDLEASVVCEDGFAIDVLAGQDADLGPIPRQVIAEEPIDSFAVQLHALAETAQGVDDEEGVNLAQLGGRVCPAESPPRPIVSISPRPIRPDGQGRCRPVVVSMFPLIDARTSYARAGSGLVEISLGPGRASRTRFTSLSAGLVSRPFRLVIANDDRLHEDGVLDFVVLDRPGDGVRAGVQQTAGAAGRLADVLPDLVFQVSERAGMSRLRQCRVAQPLGGLCSWPDWKGRRSSRGRFQRSSSSPTRRLSVRCGNGSSPCSRCSRR